MKINIYVACQKLTYTYLNDVTKTYFEFRTPLNVIHVVHLFNLSSQPMSDGLAPDLTNRKRGSGFGGPSGGKGSTAAAIFSCAQSGYVVVLKFCTSYLGPSLLSWYVYVCRNKRMPAVYIGKLRVKILLQNSLPSAGGLTFTRFPFKGTDSQDFNTDFVRNVHAIPITSSFFPVDFIFFFFDHIK
jgi:hypothetical protein